MAQERPDPGKSASQRSCAGTTAPPFGHEGAQVERAQIGEVGDPWGTAEMRGQKPQKLAQVAFIGVGGLGRQAPLIGQLVEPVLLFGNDVGGGNDERLVHDGSVICNGLPERSVVRPGGHTCGQTWRQLLHSGLSGG